MKITFILPEISLCGGVKSTLEIANRLKEKGHKVLVIYPLMPTLHMCKWYNLIKICKNILIGCKRIISKKSIRWLDLKMNVKPIFYLNEKWIPPGDIIIAVWWDNVYFLNKLDRNKGVKLHFVRGYEIWGGPKKLVNKVYMLPIKKMVNSNWLKELLEKKFNVKAEGPFYNGIDHKIFYKERKNIKDTNFIRIGIMYRNSKNKGIEDGIKAFKIVNKKIPNLRLVLFGEKINKSDRKLLSKIKNVEIYKRPYGKKLREIYNSLDIFLFTSHSEGFANPPLEAMACEVACITTPVGGSSDYAFNNKTALISPIKNPYSLSKKIIYLIRNKDKRDLISKKGNKVSAKFDWDKTTKNVEEFFKKIIK